MNPTVTESVNALAPSLSPTRIVPIALPPLSASQQSTLHTWDECIRRAAMVYRSATMAIAYYGWRIKKSGRWSEFGCVDEHDYCNQRRIPPATWKRCMEIGRVLEALTFDQLCAITVSNAHALVDVHPDIWLDYPWLDEARSLSRQQFRTLIAERNRVLRGGLSAEITRNHLQDRVIKAKLKRVRDDNGFKSNTDALEYILSDVPSSASANLLAAARHTYKLISLVVKSLRHHRSQRSQEELRILLKARERIHGGIKVAVEAIEQEREAKREHEREAASKSQSQGVHQHALGSGPVHQTETNP